jgi:D-sedoheptulose 7-phosphate isomerase
MEFINEYIESSIQAIKMMDKEKLQLLTDELGKLRKRNGRLFIAGSGGGAGHSSHAAADFRRLASIESYAIGDNLSEITGLINDESWEDSYAVSLQQSKFQSKDALLVFSVGGGDLEKSVSVNLINSVKYCKSLNGKVFGIASNSGGFLGSHADILISIPVLEKDLVTPICESLQALVWHLLVSHPRIKVRPSHWENLGGVS